MISEILAPLLQEVEEAALRIEDTLQRIGVILLLRITFMCGKFLCCYHVRMRIGIIFLCSMMQNTYVSRLYVPHFLVVTLSMS